MHVTASRRERDGEKKFGTSDFSSEKRKTSAGRNTDKYFLDAKIYESSAIPRGRIFFARKNKNTRERS
jgi:hypothetical protein